MANNDILTIKSISELHKISGYEKPTHPLISVIDFSKVEISEEQVGLKTCMDLYVVGLKDSGCGNQYGRNNYDFDEGVLFFYGPNQVQTISQSHKKGDIEGWMIIFHPDLIRNTPLGESIKKYSFFGYAVHEALHVSSEEQSALLDCIKLIRSEVTTRTDRHSQTVIASTIELLLNLSQRYYERQFNTRSAQNSDLMSRFEAELNAYFEAGYFQDKGIPSVKYFSDKLNLSQSYLSDLLKKETGTNSKEHINNFIVERAKILLLNRTDSISGIAYELGFNYPHYFSRLFKTKTGITPHEYRLLN